MYSHQTRLKNLKHKLMLATNFSKSPKTFQHASLIPTTVKFAESAPHQPIFYLTPLLHVYPHHFSFSLVFSCLQLQCLLTLIAFVSSELWHHLSFGLCSSPYPFSSLLLHYCNVFPRCYISPRCFLGPRFHIFFSLPNAVVCAFNPQPPKTFLMDRSHVSRIPE